MSLTRRMPGDPDTPTTGRRLAAFGLDYLVILAYLVILGGVTWGLAYGAIGEAWREFVSQTSRFELVVFSTTVLPVGAYFALM